MASISPAWQTQSMVRLMSLSALVVMSCAVSSHDDKRAAATSGSKGSVVRSDALHSSADQGTGSIKAADESQTGISGLVLDSNGREVAGAEVSIFEARVWWVRHLGVFARPPAKLGILRTDAKGSFHWSSDRRDPVDVEIVAPGLSRRVLSDRMPGDELIAVLQREAVITGRVIQEVDGVALPNVEVRGWCATDRERSAVTTTDSEGRFRLANLSVGEVAIEVVSFTFESGELTEVELKEGETRSVDIPVDRATIFTGSVIDSETRLPITDAYVVTSDRWQRRWNVDSAGRFRTAPIGSRNHGRLVATAPKYHESKHFKEVVVGATCDMEITMRPDTHMQLHGVMVDNDGRCLEGVLIQVFLEHGTSRTYNRFREFTATSGSDGQFTIDGLRVASSYVVRLIKEGFATMEINIDAKEMYQSERTPLQIRMSPECVIEGRTVSHDETPLRWTGVVASRFDDYPKYGMRRVTTMPMMPFGLMDDDTYWSFAFGGPGFGGHEMFAWHRVSDSKGRFRIGGLSPGYHWLATNLLGSNPEFPDQEGKGAMSIVALAAGEHVTRVVVKGYGGEDVKGRVIDLDGASIEGALVWALDEPVALGSEGLQHPAITRADGTFSIRTRSAGPKSIVARTRSPANERTPRAPVARLSDVRLSQNPVVISFDRGADIAGVVADGYGSAIEGVDVHLFDAGSGIWVDSSVTDATGAFRLRGGATGTYRLRVTSITGSTRGRDDGRSPPISLTEIGVKAGERNLRVTVPN